MPRAGRLYDVPEVVQWYIARITERANEEPTDIMDARKQLYIAQTAKTRLETDKARGDLVALTEAASLMNAIASVVAAQLDSVAPRLAALVAHENDQKVIQQLLFEEHRQVRESIANKIMELPEPSGGDSEAPAESVSGRLGGREAHTSP